MVDLYSRCKLCCSDIVPPTKWFYEMHQRMVHPPVVRHWLCFICGDILFDSSAYQEHIVRHQYDILCHTLRKYMDDSEEIVDCDRIPNVRKRKAIDVETIDPGDSSGMPHLNQCVVLPKKKTVPVKRGVVEMEVRGADLPKPSVAKRSVLAMTPCNVADRVQMKTSVPAAASACQWGRGKPSAALRMDANEREILKRVIETKRARGRPTRVDLEEQKRKAEAERQIMEQKHGEYERRRQQEAHYEQRRVEGNMDVRSSAYSMQPSTETVVEVEAAVQGILMSESDSSDSDSSGFHEIFEYPTVRGLLSR